MSIYTRERELNTCYILSTRHLATIDASMNNAKNAYSDKNYHKARRAMAVITIIHDTQEAISFNRKWEIVARYDQIF